MNRGPGRVLLLAGLALLGLLVLGRVAVGFYTEVLWHRELGYLVVFWQRFWIVAGVRAGAGVVAGTVVFLNLWIVARQLGPVRVRRRYGDLEIAERIPRRFVLATAATLAVLGGWWLAELQFDREAALGVAAWLRHSTWGFTDPVFGRDPAFYVFTLPVLTDTLDLLLLAVIWSLALVALGHVLVGGVRWVDNRLVLSRPARLHLAGLAAAMLVFLGVRYWIGRYMLVVDGTGFGGGLGYTDMQARFPGYWILAAAALVAAAAVVYGAAKRTLVAPVAGIGILLLAGLLVGLAWPAAVQKFRVEPNELSREAPFIRWNIEFTRRAYGLAALERRPLSYSPSARPDPDRVAELSRLPVWDPEPVQQVFNQEQGLFDYYRFPDVDYDRYGAPGSQVQVAIGVREFHVDGLEPANRTWQSLHLNPEYVRGLGVAAVPADTARADGGPILWVRDLRPVFTAPSAPPGLRLENPAVYFGETLSGYVLLAPGSAAADTLLEAAGAVPADVERPGGIPLDSFLRVLAFAWRFGDETLLFSGEVGPGTRLLFRRAVRERVHELAPFLVWDTDALPVIAEGRVVWLLDGYTMTPSFPLARAVTVGRLATRYLRNPVKAAVDAVTGEVTFYVLDDQDPILATYRRLFPALFRDAAELPASLQGHLRVPEAAFLTRAEILQQYHVDRPEIFYAGQNVWQRPQETAPAGGVRPYRPTYALMPDPGGTAVDYLTTMPFIAQGRQNMTAVLVARNDAARYGELMLLELPRDQQVPGPAQVEGMIEQDPVIAPELSLLRERGSRIDLGQLRVVPLDSSILYMMPIFLSAQATPIPELWRVVVSDGDRVAGASSILDALLALDLPGRARPDPAPGLTPETATPAAVWPAEALELLERAEQRLREGDWAGYGRLLDELRTLLQQASRGGANREGG